jgi:3-oxoacyl-(acyl-carrier-protein) synthase
MPSEILPRVVVTGLGVVAPNAHGAANFAKALQYGKSGIRFHQHLADSNFACQVGGIPDCVEALAESYLPAADRLAMNANMLYAAVASMDAWRDAGLAVPELDDDEVDWETGAIIGTGIGGIDTVAEKLVPKTDAGKVSRLGSAMVEQVMSSGASARVAGILGLGNQVSTNSSACNTGTEAVITAFWRLRTGLATRMLAGGSEGHSKYIWAGFDAMKVLSRGHNHEPERASRPMSTSASGFAPAAGAGVLLLETLDSARARGARIYAEIIGAALNCGGHRMGGSMTAPNSTAVIRCIRQAILSAGISPSRIGAINGHLTATFADPLEIANWATALERTPAAMPVIHATKSMIGHALGAAGGIECVASVLEVHHGFIHPSLNCEDLHPALEPYGNRIARELIAHADVEVLAKASFGFGDVNGCVLFRRFENKETRK